MGVLIRGKVLRFDEIRGYGFIAPEDGGDDVFMHANDFRDDETLFRPGAVVEFDLEDGRHSFQAALDEGGGLWIVFADPSTAQSKPFFRFLDTPTVAEDGEVLLDFNRAYLPPCAFADHYVCPVPPPGNTLEAPVRAGEMAVRTR